MPPDLDPRIASARRARGDELNRLVDEAGEEVLLALLQNPNLDERHVVGLLERLDLPASVLGVLAGEGKWSSSGGVRLRLARHPRTPKRFALAAVRQLFLFDLVRLSLLVSAPPDIRRLAEEVILTRVPHLPIGEKLTLARRGPGRVAGAVLAEGHPQAIKLALANAHLNESQVLRVLGNQGLPQRVVAAISQHPKWSCQYNVRVALIRHRHAPAAVVGAFLPQLTLSDLKMVARLEGLAAHLKKQLRDELQRRTSGPDAAAAGGAARELG